MKKLDTYYYTTSYGGTEGRDIKERKFLTEKAARENAKREDWNYSFTLYKVDRYTNELEYFINSNIMCGSVNKLAYYSLIANTEEIKYTHIDGDNKVHSVVHRKIKEKPNPLDSK